MNPLKQDPTRTVGLRKRMIAETRRRFRVLRKAIWQFIAVDDVLGLTPRTPFTFNVEKRAYEFLTVDRKLATFNEWLQGQIDAEVLSLDGAGNPWTAQYVDSAYRQGLVRAYTDTRTFDFAAGGQFFEGSKAEFLRQAFSQPEALSKVRLLATRSFENMRGLTATMKSQMNTILAQGMADGRSPYDIARQLTLRVDKMAVPRALTIARTEIINAHAEGQLDSFKQLGVDELGVLAEWSTAGDDRVCSLCAENEGKTFTVEEARGMIPLHPNCRCAWVPAPPRIKKPAK